MPPLELLDVGRPRTEAEDRSLAAACRDVLARYRAAAVAGPVPRRLASDATRAFLHLGGDPDRATASMREYDQERYGPFLGVSDEGSAAPAIREAAVASPKMRALPKSAPRGPLVAGLAVDAERLVGVGEVVAGPEEYAAIWLATVDRLPVTTNIGTQVNVRVYRPEPRIRVTAATPQAIAAAKEEITAAFKPFVETPDLKPRPRTVFLEFPRTSRITAARKRTILRDLAAFVASGNAAGKKRVPQGHVLGLAAAIGNGPRGKDVSLAAIDLAASCGLGVVLLDGTKSTYTQSTVTRGGLRDYFEPGLIGPILRRAKEKAIRVRPANLPDTETIARSIWVGLHTARSMGAHLGKYGCVPLTLDEIEDVVGLVQHWMADWSAAPVFFVDQGLIRAGAVDVERDLPRGIEIWLSTVAARGVRVVLIDTVDKANGRKLLKKAADDKTGYLTTAQIARIEAFARKPDVNIKVLWAGGLGLRDAYEMGRRNVFGIYVTSAAATTIPVAGSYVRDPALAGLKEPSKEAVVRTKTLLEAGFLAVRLAGTTAGTRIETAADRLLAALDAGDAKAIARRTTTLASACVSGWREHWKSHL